MQHVMIAWYTHVSVNWVAGSMIRVVDTNLQPCLTSQPLSKQESYEGLGLSQGHDYTVS